MSSSPALNPVPISSGSAASAMTVMKNELKWRVAIVIEVADSSMSGIGSSEPSSSR